MAVLTEVHKSMPPAKFVPLLRALRHKYGAHSVKWSEFDYGHKIGFAVTHDVPRLAFVMDINSVQRIDIAWVLGWFEAHLVSVPMDDESVMARANQGRHKRCCSITCTA